MKSPYYKLSVFLLFVIAICMTSAFQLAKKDPYQFPGTVKIVDNFYFDINEVSNITWKEYLSWIAEKEGKVSSLYQEAYPDTLVWMDNFYAYGEPFMNNYFRHPAYDNYPLVGITYQQAKNYCAWRTERVKEMFEANNIKFNKPFEYRLPKAIEWELIARGDFNKKEKRKMNKIRKNSVEGKWLNYNLAYHNLDQSTDSLARYNYARMTAPITSYFPNTYGIYHLYGNVAEMVAEEGVAKGGSFVDYYKEVYPSGKDTNYTKPTHWLGFRCVCEVMD